MENFDGVLNDLIPASVWRDSMATTVFPTAKSWEYFKRAHAPELVEARVLILGAGSRGDYVDAKSIGKAVREIMVRESIARCAALSEVQA